MQYLYQHYPIKHCDPPRIGLQTDLLATSCLNLVFVSIIRLLGVKNANFVHFHGKGVVIDPARSFERCHFEYVLLLFLEGFDLVEAFVYVSEDFGLRRVGMLLHKAFKVEFGAMDSLEI